jgi:chorismate mutase
MAEERDVKPAGDDAIDEWRRRIDMIDEQLMRLLNSRSACAVEIGKVKRALGLPVYSPEREAWILERVMRENPGPLDPMAVKRVFERIIDESRRLERLAVDRDRNKPLERPQGELPPRPSGIHSRDGGTSTTGSPEDAALHPDDDAAGLRRQDELKKDKTTKKES